MWIVFGGLYNSLSYNPSICVVLFSIYMIQLLYNVGLNSLDEHMSIEQLCNLKFWEVILVQ